jgi:hypothetical protein
MGMFALGLWKFIALRRGTTCWRKKWSEEAIVTIRQWKDHQYWRVRGGLWTLKRAAQSCSPDAQNAAKDSRLWLKWFSAAKRLQQKTMPNLLIHVKPQKPPDKLLETV